MGRKVHVLVVENDADTRESLSMLMELHGYSVTAVPSGTVALDHLAKGLRPCVILLDLIMPDMNGLHFIRELREGHGLASIPIVVCTGYEHLREPARTLGATEALLKPIDPHQLLKLVGGYCPDAHAPSA